jgi:hypothetical protein
MNRLLLLILAVCSLMNNSLQAQETHSVAHKWMDAQLAGIRVDFARPPIHARNLYQNSMAMYDAWAVYDTTAETMMLGKNFHGYDVPFTGVPQSILDQLDIEQARETAISYAAYRILTHRYLTSPGALTTLPRLDSLMNALGYDPGLTSTSYQFGSPAALGNYIAEQLIAYGYQDGANEINDYTNMYYEAINPDLVLTNDSNGTGLVDPNRWQPLSLTEFVDQSGIPFSGAPPFQSPEWGLVDPYALQPSQSTVHERDGESWEVYLDPGHPVYIGGDQTAESDSLYKWHFAMVSVWQAQNDPSDGVMIDISPATIGNTDVSLFPNTWAEHGDFYNFFDGGDPGLGHALNPATQLPYETQMVYRGDYVRILAEFWADGPNSETPPGHWFGIYNEVSDYPAFNFKWKGEGAPLDELQYDIKAYVTLGGAMHDAAITAWGIKGYYDYVRPVSAIRYMAENGQSSDMALPNYSPDGIPLIPGYIEQISDTDTLAGPNGENIGEIKLYSWRGHEFIQDTEVDMAGVGWILASHWWPYQRPNFVTPPFAGYVSGHSTFSRAAAEVMTGITGDPFFPGGMGTFLCPQNEFLIFEEGPTTDVTLQWATYRDASDQCSLSRIWGGIHPSTDDIPGRRMGIVIGEQSVEFSDMYFSGNVGPLCGVDADGNCMADLDGNGEQELGDFLVFLSEFGLSGIYVSDLDGDMFVTTGDLLFFLQYYGCNCL